MNTACSIRSAAMAASAGTGKTFALSSRYLALLAGGADPASIVALTFTRKAAGEILARILTRLAQAAASAKEFADLNRHLVDGGLPEFASHAAAQAALHDLVHALPGLRIGADSFCRFCASSAWNTGLRRAGHCAGRASRRGSRPATAVGTGGRDAAPPRADGGLPAATFGKKKSVYGALQDRIGTV